MITYTSFKKENINYWTKRAPGYSSVNKDELTTSQHDRWSMVISEHISAQFPQKHPSEISVLDVGTGPGFFAIILAELGYRVTAVDYTESMLDEARKNAGELATAITFHTMDAQNLNLADHSFDVLLSRNVTWNLYKPEDAYREWSRVLKKGGILLNFDANWYRYLHDPNARSAHIADKKNVRAAGVSDENEGTDVDSMEAIAAVAPLSTRQRPEWDISFLSSLGMSASADRDIWKRVWTLEERINNASTPMFMTRAVKA